MDQSEKPPQSSNPIAGQPDSSSDSRPLVLPADVRAGQLLGLVEIIGGLGSSMDVAKLADEFGANLVTLLPILDTGEMLGLVKVDKGDISLTELGLKFQKTSKSKVKMLKDRLSKIEPFRTALELLAEKESFSTSEISEILWNKNIRWHHQRETNDKLVQELLIHWAIYAGLLSYNGKTGLFQKA